jgi:hypothetical protein
MLVTIIHITHVCNEQQQQIIHVDIANNNVLSINNDAMHGVNYEVNDERTTSITMITGER